MISIWNASTVTPVKKQGFLLLKTGICMTCLGSYMNPRVSADGRAKIVRVSINNLRILSLARLTA